MPDRRLRLPREHGAWAMLALGLGTGWALRPAPDLTGAMTTAGWVLAFLGQETPLLLGPAALCLGGAAWRDGVPNLLALAIGGTLGLAALVLRALRRRGGRVALFAWDAHLAASLAMATPVALLGLPSLSPAQACHAGLATACGFAAGVLGVQARRPGSGPLPLLAWSLASAAAWTLSPTPVGWLGWLAFPARLAHLRLRPRAGWKEVGWSEVVLGTWLAAWVAASLPR